MTTFDDRLPANNRMQPSSLTLRMGFVALFSSLFLAGAGSGLVLPATAVVPVGSGALAIAVNSVTNKVYVANRDDGTVTVIDGATNTTTTVAVGMQPVALAVNPATNKVYVANQADNTVTVIDGATHASSTVSVGAHPVAVAANPVTNKVYVANRADNTVTVIDGATSSVAVVNVGVGPVALDFNTATNQIYVANYGENTVTVIDGSLNTTTTVTLDQPAIALAVNAVTNTIWLAVPTGPFCLEYIDGNTNTVRGFAPSSGQSALAIAVNPVPDRIYAMATFPLPGCCKNRRRCAGLRRGL